MKSKLFALLVTVFLVATAPSLCMEKGNSTSEVIPPNPTGFIGSWHPVPECGQCHVTLLTGDELRAKLGSCRCHDKVYITGGKIDRDTIRTVAHGSKVCVDCHVGSGILISAGNIPSNGLHRAHELVDCQACHGNGSNPIIPKTNNCTSCHLGGVHTIHGKETGELCVVCHGAFGIKYKAEGYQGIEGVPVAVKPKEVEYPTILNTLKALIKFIIRG